MGRCADTRGVLPSPPRRPSTAPTVDPITSCRALECRSPGSIPGEPYRRRRADRSSAPAGCLDAEITRSFEASGDTYGSPRATRDLHEADWRVSENSAAARMAELGLVIRRRR
ncbi:transposase [Nonomuraea sp. KM90]|uniref:transposase n=1 Tax=Nonomuraea sp. KM90 TaxID=3457428 RepID=UPI003FCE252C